MKIVFEHRASIILYNFLIKLTNKKPFLLPSNICPIIPAVFNKARVPFIFIDIELSNFEIDKIVLLDKIRREGKYGGILWLRPYGFYSDRSEIFKKIKSIDPELMIIDDRCLSIPRFSSDNNVVDLILYSTGYSKFVELGWGGIGFIQTSNKYYQRCLLPYSQKNLNLLNEYHRICVTNSENIIYNDCDWLGDTSIEIDINKYKTLICEQLKISEKQKEKINTIYSNTIHHASQLPTKYNSWRFNIMVNRKDELLKNIFSNNLFASSHYSSLSALFSQPRCKNAEKISKKIINLFNDFRFNPQKAEKISAIVNLHINKYGSAQLV